MTDTPLLLPMPRRLELTGGTLTLTDDQLITLTGPEPQALRDSAGVD